MRVTVRHETILAALAGLALALLITPEPARAQIPLGDWRLEGEAALGSRFFIDEPAKSRRSKWEEYRDFPGGPFVPDVQLRIFRKDESYSAEFAGTKWGQTDQEYSLRAGRLGLWEFGFDWDQIPHLYTTNARFLATEVSRGYFALPTPRPALEAHNSAPTIDIRQRWDTARMFFDITPTPDLRLKAEYTRIRKDGDRPFSMSFGGPGNNFYEILEPIEQTIHDFRIGATWARKTWQLQAGYVLSVFQNDLDAVRADNPCFGAPAPAGCGGDATGAPATGRTSLPPNNMAHTMTVNGGVNLPWWRTRLTGNFSYSLQLQNQDFLPHTINPAFSGNPALDLPQKSLHGNVQTILLNLGVVTRPLRDVTLSLKYRLFDYMDLSDEINFPLFVIDDRTLQAGSKAPRKDYQRQNADADVRWQAATSVALTTGVGWERWDRSKSREVPISDELYAKAAVDVTPIEEVLVRLTYRPSFRRISNYDTLAPQRGQSIPEDPAANTRGQSVLLRKYDEAERNRQRVDLMVQVTPTDTLSITPTASYIFDDYLSKPPVDPAGTGRQEFLGVQEAVGWTAGVDLSWSPVERLSITAGYTHDSFYRKMESRSRPVVGGLALDFHDFDWISNITDTVDTLYGGVKYAIIPRVLDWGVSGSWSYALGRIETRNPTAPVSGTAALNLSARAKPVPAFEDELIRLETAVAYHFLKNWTLSFGYVFESFQKHDWRTDKLNPFVPTAGSSIWLGNDLRNYTAHTLGAVIRYSFR